jgi:hypothetical protein
LIQLGKPSDSVVGERAPRLAPLPSIVIVADEFADMIMQVGKKAEEMITRLRRNLVPQVFIYYLQHNVHQLTSSQV